MPRRRRTVTERSNANLGDAITIDGADGVTLDAASGIDDSDAFAGDFVNPANIGNGDGSGGDGDGSTAGANTGKRRYRRRKTASAKAAESISVEGLSSIMMTAHMLLAGITKTAEWNLDKTEADTFAQATADVMRHYPNAVISPKTVDTINFAMIAATIYGTRIMAIRERIRQEKAGDKAKPVDATVTARRDPIQPSAAGGKAPDDFFPANGFPNGGFQGGMN